MAHKPTGMRFYLLEGTEIVIDRMAHKPTRREVEKLKLDAEQAFMHLKESEE